MNKITSSLLVAAGIGLASSSVALGITNLGFETGTLTGWNVNAPGNVNVVTSHDASGDGRHYDPQEGLYFARLVAGIDADVYTTISQTFTMAAGEIISGAAAFDGGDSFPYDDNAFLQISTPSGLITLWSASIGSVGDYTSTPWQSWSYMAVASDTYTLTFGVANGLDNDYSSLAMLDLGSSEQLPDNGAMLSLLGVSLVGLFGLRSRSFGLR